MSTINDPDLAYASGQVLGLLLALQNTERRLAVVTPVVDEDGNYQAAVDIEIQTGPIFPLRLTIEWAPGSYMAERKAFEAEADQQ